MSSNPFLFLAPLGGSLAFQDRNGGGTLTGSGAVRWQAASGARTNLVVNPSFETNTTGWGLLSGATITRITTDAASGSACLQVAATGTVNSGVSESGATSSLFASRVAHTASFWVKLSSGDSSDWHCRFVETDAAGTVIGGNLVTQAFTPTASWTRVSVTGTPSQTGSHRLQLRISRIAGTGSASTILIDAVQTEEGSTATDYFDGSTGGAWLDPITGILGTAHASPSVSQAAAWVEEGTTNALPNPSFETNTTNWAGSAATISRDTTYAYIGSASLKVVTNNVAAFEGATIGSLTVAALTGQAWSSSVWMRGSGTVLLGMAEFDSGGVFIAGQQSFSSVITLTDQWTRYSLARTLAGGASTAFVTMKVITDVQQAATFYLDATQLEQKAYATSYCDGAIGTGYAWSGTAHASSSTRTATTIAVPEDNRILAARGAVATRAIPQGGRTGDRELIRVGEGTAGLDMLRIVANLTTGTLLHSWQSNGAAAQTVTKSAAAVVDTWRAYFVNWVGVDISATYDVVALSSGTRAAVQGSLASASDFRIGSYDAVPQNVFNGLIGPVAIANRPLTAKERAKLYALTSWAWGTLRGGRVGLLMPR